LEVFGLVLRKKDKKAIIRKEFVLKKRDFRFENRPKMIPGFLCDTKRRHLLRSQPPKKPG
jgi:hypothetical protein